ncbi:hypothetical protein FRAHR75_730011 [Frankia sp. Hr75.2]|nr:hypothetical protein FRAHR75_730011 [Frankia sp. Hr75.2]
MRNPCGIYAQAMNNQVDCLLHGFPLIDPFVHELFSIIWWVRAKHGCLAEATGMPRVQSGRNFLDGSYAMHRGEQTWRAGSFRNARR